MKKATGMFFAASVLCCWLMASFAVAAPPGSQPPSSSNQVPLVFPDLKIANIYIVPVNTQWDPNNLGPTTLFAGDQVKIFCSYDSCGCFGNNLYWYRVDIDGALFLEQGGLQGPNQIDHPMCSLKTTPCIRATFKTGIWEATLGSHTIKCILDSKDNITEGLQQELNNTKSITVNVTLPKSAIDKMKDIKTKQPTIPIPVPTPGVR